MTFNAYPPAKVLAPFVVSYLEADSRYSTQTEVHQLFPNGFSGIFFNYGTLGSIAVKEEYKTPRVSIFGQIDQCFDAIHLPGSYSFGVLLHPTVLHSYLRLSMTELTNRAMDGCLLRSDLYLIHEQLESLSTTEKIRLLNRYFSKVFPIGNPGNSLPDHALQIIQLKQGITIHDLADELKISERHLEVEFKKSVGLSPKTYALILRFKRMEEQIRQKGVVRWEQMNFAHEYYDQNHFIKEFKRFTGNTPSDYLLQNFEMGRSYLLH